MVCSNFYLFQFSRLIAYTSSSIYCPSLKSVSKAIFKTGLAVATILEKCNPYVAIASAFADILNLW